MKYSLSQKHISLFKNDQNIKDTFGIHETRLLQKAQKIVPYLSKIPWILVVAVGNSVAMKSAHSESDIDLYIITRNNRLWTTRIYTTLFFSLLWQRKTQKHHAGKFCLSFFATQKAMDFSNIAIKNDIYLAYWIETLIPLINKDQTFEKFQEANNWYVWEIARNSKKQVSTSPKQIQVHHKHTSIFTPLWDFQEYILKKIFLPRTRKSYTDLGEPFWVIISDDMLKFHDKDRREDIRDRILSHK